ncbi:Ribonuclease H-like superfamily protein [Rhynchospora pubera]|uniref:Ribonuclease H-like superfamily protein n=1 Tax=Rhynchospora pubera TaxID=906938 RepID=A0AAV8DDJ2_9POAL|nr:Ribonuclease H-like superfamily protein [Rhynchospora pubera]
MSDDNKLWVQVCKAKYYPKIGFWNAKCNTSASHLWKQVNKIKHKFKEEVVWSIGDGQKAHVISQPWFRGWEVTQQVTLGERGKTVAQLYDFDTDHWKMEELQRLFNTQQVATILAEVAKPTLDPQIKDRLIWLHTKAGNYSVKEGYQRLIQLAPRNGNVEGELWKRIWGWKGVVPKVRIFMWRLLSKALPVAQNMHTRINRFSPTCQRCHEENEYEVHCFFFCHGSRAVWFGSQLGFQTQHLPLNIVEAVKQIGRNLNEEDLKVFSYTMWELWKERNEAVLHKRHFQPKAVIQKVKGWLRPIENLPQIVPQDRHISNEGRYEYHGDGWQIITDGSWDVNQAAGTAHLIYKGGMLMALGVQSGKIGDAFLVEAVALRQAIEHLKVLTGLQQESVIQFYTDCECLAIAINENDLQNIPSWKAMKEVAKIIENIKDLGRAATLIHIPRKAVQGAHLLANQARTSQTSYIGVPNLNVWPDLQHFMVLDGQVFQQVQEAPP